MIKTYKILFQILSIGLLSSFVVAGEIKLDPASNSYSSGCIIGVDITMDPKGNKIAATDIILESSMEYLGIKKYDLFPYFLPVSHSGNIIHIVGFTSGPRQHITSTGVIARVYYKPKSIFDRDGSIRILIKNIGNTTDTNLSIGGGIDILDKVENAYYRFDGEQCPKEDLEGLYDQNMETIIQNIEKDEKQYKWKMRIENNKIFIALLILLLWILIFYKKHKGKKEITQ